MRNSSIFAMVTGDLTLVEAELLSVIQTPVQMLADISVHLTKAGGKRLRPALYLLCANFGS
ncbi:MAG: hepT [Anaerospora sp.]|nr:hepT [Anaerospora sp.]